MSGIWISPATIARFAVAGSHGNSDTLPDGMWLMEYPEEAGRQRSLKTRLESPEYKAVRDEMKPLISHADLGVWEQN